MPCLAPAAGEGLRAVPGVGPDLTRVRRAPAVALAGRGVGIDSRVPSDSGKRPAGLFFFFCFEVTHVRVDGPAEEEEDTLGSLVSASFLVVLRHRRTGTGQDTPAHKRHSFGAWEEQKKFTREVQ